MDDAARKRLKEAVERSGRSMRSIQEEAGVNESFLRDVFRKNVDPSVSNLAKLASVLGTNIGAIMSGNQSPRTVPVVGYIEDGGSVYFVTEDFDSEELDQVLAPPGASLSVVATVVKSDSAIGIAEKGWLLYFDSESQEPTHEMAGKLCVCWLDSGDIVMRKIYPGSAPNRWNLFQLSSQTMLENVHVLRAAPVLWMKPR